MCTPTPTKNFKKKLLKTLKHKNKTYKSKLLSHIQINLISIMK